MTKIHMETEQVFQLGARLTQQAHLIQERVDLLAQQVESAPWQGRSRDEFIMQFADCQQRLLQHGEQLYELRISLYKEVEQWLDAAAVFGGGNVSGGASGGSGWQSWRDTDLGRSERLVDQLLDFQNSETGKRLAEEAAAAGLLFVIMDGGKIIGYWGMPGGKEITIGWGEMNNAYGYFDGDHQIKLNEKLMGNDHVYEHTLIHEMQHAIDFHKPNVDIDKINYVDNLTSDQAGQMTADELEKAFSEKYTEYAKTEVNAHDMGYDFEGSDTGKILDHTDGQYTKEEFDFIINTRSYEENYEGYINRQLKEWFGEDTNYRADVWVDKDGRIQVDIDQSRPLLERVWDSIF